MKPFTSSLSFLNSNWQWKEASVLFEKGSKSVFVFLIYSYKYLLSAQLGGSCRFQPSCSEYALQAFKTHDLKTALQLTTSRLAKCRPGGPYGLDPVPNKSENK